MNGLMNRKNVFNDKFSTELLILRGIFTWRLKGRLGNERAKPSLDSLDIAH